MRYGTSTPAALVERAAEHGQPALALTDRDGLYGAVKFVQAATAAGIAPVLGVDLAVLAGEPGFRPGTGRAAYGTGSGPAAYGTGTGTGRAAYGTGSGPAAYGTGQGWGSGAPGWRDVPGALGAEGTSLPRVRTPVRGGAERDPRHPRVTVLARGGGAGLPAGVGWASLCRLVTDTHLSGERGQPVTTAAAIARRCAVGDEGGSGPLTVLLGPDSDVGRALLARRSRSRPRPADRLAAGPAPRRAGDRGRLPRRTGGHPCVAGPRRPHARAGRRGRPSRRADRGGAPRRPGGGAIVDVLDAARRLVVLDTRHLDRVTDAAHLASTPAMHAIAREVTSGDGTRADALIARTLTLAMACAQDARRDLGIGVVHLPEPTSLGIEPGVDPQSVLEQRCREAVVTRYPGAGEHELHTLESRLTDELKVVAELGYPTYFLTVADGRRPDPRHGGAGRRARLGRRVPGQLPARHQRGRPDPLRPADGAVLLSAAGRAARHRHRRGVGPAHRGLRAHPRPVRRRAGHLRLDDGHLQGAPRDPRRGRGAGPAAAGDRRDRQGLPAHPGQGRPQRHRRAARAALAGVWTPHGCGPAVRPRRAPRRAAPPHRAAPVRRGPVRRRRCSTAPRSRRAGWASR